MCGCFYYACSHKIVDPFSLTADLNCSCEGGGLGYRPIAFFEYQTANGKIKTLACQVRFDQTRKNETRYYENGVWKEIEILLPNCPKGAIIKHLIIGNRVGYAKVENIDILFSP